jgi:hypothetical protein
LLRSGARIAAIIATTAVLLGLTAASAFAGQVAGVQTHVMWGGVSDAQMRHQLDLVKASGATLTRVDVGWASLQQDGPNGYSPWYLERLDALVAAADERDIDLLLTFMNTPCWASTAPESLKQACAGAWWDRGVTAYAPADPQDYARALAFLAARYGDRVAAWEIWNEPNHPDFSQAPDQAAAYARLLKAAYPAVKAANPHTTVVGGALSLCDYAFLQRLYDLGAKGSFDAFSVHPYSDDLSPLDARAGGDPRYSFVRGVPKIRATMLANGDSRPIWLTESGWTTSTVRGAEHWLNGVSEAAQALYVRQQAEQVVQWPYVKANITFNLLDVGSDRADRNANFGLVRVDGSAKPAFAAIRTAATTLAAGAPAAAPAAAAAPSAVAAVAKKPAAKTKPRRKAARARAARARKRARRHRRDAHHHRRHGRHRAHSRSR